MSAVLFKAKTSYGSVIKSLIDVYKSCLTKEVCFFLKKNGIYSMNTDIKRTMLLELSLPINHFEEYICTQERCISVQLKDCSAIIKNIKKKHKIILFIKEKKPNKLGIKIFQSNDDNEVSHIMIRDIVHIPIDISSDYYVPKVISSAKFQNLVKKLSTISGTNVDITIQENNYARFYCDSNNIIDNETKIGKKIGNENVYNDSFLISMLKQLVKICSLDTQIQLTSPKNNEDPLLIVINVGKLGHLKIFLKSISQIESEKEQTN